MADRTDAEWTAATVNDLPDEAFLYVEPGGEKDEDGKTTPRSLRHFPYRNAAGDVDLSHLRNALARIPQASLSPAVKARLSKKAQKILEGERTDADDDQPRIPSGSPDGGQFAAGAGSGAGIGSLPAGMLGHTQAAHEANVASSEAWAHPTVESHKNAIAKQKAALATEKDPGLRRQREGTIQAHEKHIAKLNRQAKKASERLHSVDETTDRVDEDDTATPTRRRVMRFERYDQLRAPERTDAGFLKAEGRIARVGVQVYQDADGKIRRELRPAEEVLSDAALASFRQVPVTNTHPPGLLDPQSAKRFTVGAVGEDVRSDGGQFVEAPLVLYDAGAIAAVEAGRTQLSCGYSCEVDETPGVWNGERYDAVQRSIRGNHLALVDTARGGPELKIRLDSGDAVMLPTTGASAPKEKTMGAQVRVDGITLELNETNASAIQQAIDKALTQKQAKLDAADAGVKHAREVIADLQAKLDAAKAAKAASQAEMIECPECDGTGKVDGEKCKNCDGTGKVPENLGDDDDDDDEDEDEEKRDAKKRAARAKRDKARKDSLERMVARGVHRRVALELEARKHLGADVKLDGMSDVDVKRAVIAKLAPDTKLDGKAEVYVDARFDAECEIARRRPGAVDQARAGASPLAGAGRADEAPRLDPKAARERMLANLREAGAPRKAS